MKQRTIRLGVIAISALIVMFTGPALCPLRAMVFPADEWQEATPQSQGIDPGVFQDALAKVTNKNSFVVVRNGYVIFKGSRAGQISRIYSCGKNFAGTIFAAMVSDGNCSATDLVSKYVPTVDDKYPAYSKIALRHLASMTAGYDGGTCGEPWGGSVTVPCQPRFGAGSKYEYWDDNTEMLVHACTYRARQANPAHRDSRQLFLDMIAVKIGIGSSEFDHNNELYPAASDGTPVYPWAGAVRITPLAHARLAHLWLNKGHWAGEQVLDSAFVEQATQPQGSDSYGYTWWLGDIKTVAGSFGGHGYANNFSFIIPKWSMVVISQNGDSRQLLVDGFFAALAKGISVGPTPAVSSSQHISKSDVSTPAKSYTLQGKALIQSGKGRDLRNIGIIPQR